MALTDFSGFDIVNQNAELVPVLQCEFIVSLSNELDATLCSHCTTDPNSSFWYNMALTDLTGAINQVNTRLFRTFTHLH